MSCLSVQNSITAYLDELLTGDAESRITQHLAHCRDCADRAELHRLSRAALRSLPAVAPPPELVSRLRVAASHERERRLGRLDLSTRLENLSERLQLCINNLMRPLALPCAGGLLSALVLFTMLVPTLGFQFDRSNDISTGFYTEPSLLGPLSEDVPFPSIDEGMPPVELTIDERGQVTDWSVPGGKLDRQAEKGVLANLVWFSVYRPASLFGQPASGKITVSFQRSGVTVKPEPESKPDKLESYVITVRG